MLVSTRTEVRGGLSTKPMLLPVKLKAALSYSCACTSLSPNVSPPQTKEISPTRMVHEPDPAAKLGTSAGSAPRPPPASAQPPQGDSPLPDSANEAGARHLTGSKPRGNLRKPILVVSLDTDLLETRSTCKALLSTCCLNRLQRLMRFVVN